MQTIASGAQSIMLGEADVVLAGGIESMSRMPYLVDADDARWGHRMGNFTLVDAMYRDGFTCSVCGMIMGETAEVLAREYGITREASDAYALETQPRRRAGHRGRPFSRRDRADGVHATRKGKPQTLEADEHPRPGTTIESLRKLPLVFGDVEGAPGIITAGSSSGITDGGAAVVLMSAERARRDGRHAAGAHCRLGERRRRSAQHGHRPRAGGAEAAATAPASVSRTSISSS